MQVFKWMVERCASDGFRCQSGCVKFRSERDPNSSEAAVEDSLAATHGLQFVRIVPEEHVALEVTFAFERVIPRREIIACENAKMVSLPTSRRS